MARRELGPAALRVAQAVAAVIPSGPVVVGVSGGADSLALALGARWAAARSGTDLLAVTVDHGLQPGSDEVAQRVIAQLAARDIRGVVRTVEVSDAGGGLEADARDARLAALSATGHPVLLGHTMDDQAEQVLLGIFRGSGTRSLAGMSPRRDLFLRPLLDIRRTTTEQACREWGIDAWEDPHNAEVRFTRVRARRHLAELNDALGRDLSPMLARTAELARIDADHLDALAEPHVPATPELGVAEVAELAPALRLRVLRAWLRRHGLAVEMVHILAVDRLLTGWRGQGPIELPGGRVLRRGAHLRCEPMA